MTEGQRVNRDTTERPKSDAPTDRQTPEYKAYKLEQARSLALGRGGRLLSVEYKGANEAMEWECADGHTWDATANTVVNRGSWCQQCSHAERGKEQRIDIEEFRSIATKRGGRLISIEYTGGKDLMEWECAEKHQWSATGESIRINGTWCPDCAGNKKTDISVFQEIAGERGGRLISKEYKGSHERMEWECAEKHQWKASGDSVKNGGTWCPECKISIGEAVSRQVMENGLGVLFPTARPKWLQPKEGWLQLDGYNEQVQVAFEYHGAQHYKYNPQFHREGKGLGLEDQQSRDALKRDTCKKHGVILIEIPYTVKVRAIPAFVYRACVEAGLNVKKSKFRYDLSKLKPLKRMQLDKLQAIAKKHGGRLLSKEYINKRESLDWECKEGHQWSTSADVILNGHSWCPDCAGNKILDVSVFDKIAQSYGGRLISRKYLGAHEPLEWECAQEHRWKATPASVKNRGTWCPCCSVKKAWETRRENLSKADK